jgi:uncharacterized membrane protein YkvA (DUF1232 family)
MTGSWWWDLLLGIAAALAVTWLALVVTLAIVRPRGGLLHEALRLLPDVLRLVRRLAADPDLPGGVRVRLALLLVYLAFPLDLVPDFIPVLGYADDAIIVTAVLRSVVRRAGLGAIRRRWPGTPDGFTVLCRLTGLSESSSTPCHQRRDYWSASSGLGHAASLSLPRQCCPSPGIGGTVDAVARTRPPGQAVQLLLPVVRHASSGRDLTEC